MFLLVGNYMLARPAYKDDEKILKKAKKLGFDDNLW